MTKINSDIKVGNQIILSNPKIDREHFINQNVNGLEIYVHNGVYWVSTKVGNNWFNREMNFNLFQVMV